MNRLLIITSDYYPYPSSNTNCLEPLFEILEKEGWGIDIITRKMYKDSSSYEDNAARRIYRIEDYRTMHTIAINIWRNRASSAISKAFYTVWAIMSKGAYYIRYCCFRREPLVSGWDKKKVIKKCISLNKSNDYKAIISVSTPVLNHEIAYQVKKRFLSLCWIYMEFDPFSMGEHLYGKNTYSKLYPEHVLYFSSCNMALTIPQLYKYYENSPDFKRFLSKIKIIDYPNMRKIVINYYNVSPITFSEREINCVFAGVLQANIRDPEYFFKVFFYISYNIHAHLISGSRLGFIKKEIAASKNITVYPKQTRDTCYDAMKRANILINIGNNVSFQTPGKIFEYMAMGKPIIHFCKIPDDPCLHYFKNYPLVLIIKEYENRPEEDAEKITEFCSRYKDTTLSYEKVIEYIPDLVSENVTQRFLEIMNNLTPPEGEHLE